MEQIEKMNHYGTPTKEHVARNPVRKSSPNVDARVRRVQFTKQLEITKTPPALSKGPILRVRSRGGDHIRRSADRFNQTNHSREPDGTTVHLFMSDPPTNVSKEPLFSPSFRDQDRRSQHVLVQARELPPTPSRTPSRRLPFTDSRVHIRQSRVNSQRRASSSSPVRPARLLHQIDTRDEQSDMHGRNGAIPTFHGDERASTLRKAYTEKGPQQQVSPEKWTLAKYITENLAAKTPDAKAILADLAQPVHFSPESQTSTDSESEFLLSKPSQNSSWSSTKRSRSASKAPHRGGKTSEMEDEINEKSNQQRKAASIMDHDFEKDKNIGKNKATRIQLASPYGASKSPNEKYRFDALNLVNKGTASTEEMDVKDEWGLYKDESFSDDSEGDDNFLLPNAKSEAKSQTKRRLCPVSFLLCLFLCGLGAGLPIYLLLFHGNKDVAFLHAIESSNCATEESNGTFSSRYLSIWQELRRSTVGSSMMNVAESPQRKSLCWLSDFDARQLHESNLSELVQRYTLGVLFFALASKESDDPSSLRNSDFLSDTHECEWGVTLCNNGQITALLMADTFLEGVLPDEIANLSDLSE